MCSPADGPESTGWSHRPPGSSGRHPRPSLPGHTGLHRWSCAGRCPPRRNTGTQPGAGSDAIGHLRHHLREHPSTGPLEPRGDGQRREAHPSHLPDGGPRLAEPERGAEMLETARVGTRLADPPRRGGPDRERRDAGIRGAPGRETPTDGGDGVAARGEQARPRQRRERRRAGAPCPCSWATGEPGRLVTGRPGACPIGPCPELVPRNAPGAVVVRRHGGRDPHHTATAVAHDPPGRNWRSAPT